MFFISHYVGTLPILAVSLKNNVPEFLVPEEDKNIFYQSNCYTWLVIFGDKFASIPLGTYRRAMIELDSKMFKNYIDKNNVDLFSLILGIRHDNSTVSLLKLETTSQIKSYSYINDLLFLLFK